MGLVIAPMSIYSGNSPISVHMALRSTVSPELPASRALDGTKMDDRMQRSFCSVKSASKARTARVDHRTSGLFARRGVLRHNSINSASQPRTTRHGNALRPVPLQVEPITQCDAWLHNCARRKVSDTPGCTESYPASKVAFNAQRSPTSMFALGGQESDGRRIVESKILK